MYFKLISSLNIIFNNYGHIQFCNYKFIFEINFEINYLQFRRQSWIKSKWDLVQDIFLLQITHCSIGVKYIDSAWQESIDVSDSSFLSGGDFLSTQLSTCLTFSNPCHNLTHHLSLYPMILFLSSHYLTILDHKPYLPSLSCSYPLHPHCPAHSTTIASPISSP